MSAIAIILAAGKSTRFGSPKAFAKLGNETLLKRVVRTYASHPAVRQVIVVSRTSEIGTATRILRKLASRKPCTVIPGGTSRQASAYAGLRFLEKQGTEQNTRVLFHNVANPLVTRGDISAVLRVVRKYRAAAVGTPLTATVKIIRNGGQVTRTIPRATLWTTETPQCVHFGTALLSHKNALKRRHAATDDLELVEYLGVRVALVPASPHNFKVTTRADLETVRALIARNGRNRHRH